MDNRLPPDDQPNWDRQLWLMILASGLVHALIVIGLLLVPKNWLQQPTPPLVSYSVDLIAPDKLGGSNMVQGGKGRLQAPPLVAAAPPAAKAEAKPAAAEPAKVEPANPEPPKPEPPKPEIKEVEKPPEPKVENKPAPEPPKPEPKDDAVALAKREPSPTPPKVSPSPKVAAPASPQAIAKAEPTKPQPTIAKVDPKATVEAKKAAEAKAAEVKAVAAAKAAAEKAAVEKAAAEKAAAEKAAVEKATAEKAAAEKAAAEKAAADKLAKDNEERDSQIAAAIRRVQQKGERGGGLGTSEAEQPGGPLGAGPGEGIGGQVMGVEYLLYYNQTINRIRQSWAWAGTNEALEATVHFSITESGEIVDVKVTKSSGDKGFDLSAERAVRAVSPLAAPPEQYRKDFADFELVFNPRDMKM